MNNNTPIIQLLLLIFCLSLFACNANNSTGMMEMTKDGNSMAYDKIAITEDRSEMNQTANQSISVKKVSTTETSNTNPNTTIQNIERKLIKTANLRFEVKKYLAGKTQILETVKTHGAIITSENEVNSNHSKYNDMVIRVPFSKFDELVDALLANAYQIDQKQITAKDVTEEYIDVAARLKTKEALEQRYLEILKKAKTIEEILQVEAKINAVRGEIESAAGRLRYLKNQVSESTIRLRFYEDVPGTSYSEPSFFGELSNAFYRGWQGFLWVILLLAHFWLAILIGGIVVYLFVRWRRKRR
ncbi:MAG: DUF4349 domain-containing protein [Chitinophagales bacterium]